MEYIDIKKESGNPANPTYILYSTGLFHSYDRNRKKHPIKKNCNNLKYDAPLAGVVINFKEAKKIIDGRHSNKTRYKICKEIFMKKFPQPMKSVEDIENRFLPKPEQKTLEMRIQRLNQKKDSR